MINEKSRYFKAYIDNRFIAKRDIVFPLADEPHLKAWINYVAESIDKGAFKTVREKLVQLQFPVQESLSKTDGYNNATLRGKSMQPVAAATGLQLLESESIQLSILNGPVGAIPVLTIPHPDDFANIVRVLAHKNEPVPIPNSMGACLIRGLNNWDRINALKKEWCENNTDLRWPQELKTNIIPHKFRYQDTLMLLSEKPYSGIESGQLGLPSKDWLQRSMTIRKYHEYAHYFTARVYGKMSKSIYDELLADYLGISMAFGMYDSHLFLKFIGLEAYPKYRAGGRLENYVEMDKLVKEEFETLTSLCVRASGNLENFDKALGPSQNIPERIKRLNALCKFSLSDLAQIGFHKHITKKYHCNEFVNSVN